MFKKLVKGSWLVFCLSSILVLSVEGAVACDDNTAIVLARATRISNIIYPRQEFYNFVKKYRSYFVQGGTAIRCAERVGNRIIRKSVVAYDTKAYDRAMGIAADAGRPDLARGVADSMNSGAAAAMTFGYDLLWLAKVLPPLANGDARPFLNTATQTRQQLRAVYPMMQMIMQMNQNDPFPVNYQQIFDSMGPILEHQTRIYIAFFGQP